MGHLLKKVAIYRIAPVARALVHTDGTTGSLPAAGRMQINSHGTW